MVDHDLPTHLKVYSEVSNNTKSVSLTVMTQLNYRQQQETFIRSLPILATASKFEIVALDCQKSSLDLADEALDRFLPQKHGLISSLARNGSDC